jgi:hypothetical protein
MGLRPDTGHGEGRSPVATANQQAQGQDKGPHFSGGVSGRAGPVGPFHAEDGPDGVP